MAEQSQSPTGKKKDRSDLSTSLGLAAVLAFFIVSGFVSYYNTRILNQSAGLVAETHEVISSLSSLLSVMKDAETGQRGYVLTGEDKYLAPYTEAVNEVKERLVSLDRSLQGRDIHMVRLPAIKLHVENKLAELEKTVAIRKNQGFEAALAIVLSDRGKQEMDALRTLISDMQQDERDIRAKRLEDKEKAYQMALTSGILAGLLGVFLSGAVAVLIRRSVAVRKRQEWLQSGQVGLSDAISGELRVDELGDRILAFLSEYFGAQAGAFFAKEGSEYRRVATYGVPADSDTPTRFAANDGLLGQAVKSKKTIFLDNVPEKYLTIGSSLGQGAPRYLIISPAETDGFVNAVFELGFVNQPDENTIELLNRVNEAIAIAMRSANYRVNLQNFLEETQRQAEELQAQSEELKVSNEELEEQSRALKESQVRLEQQQAEMEQTNSQLEEQTQLLETQRDELSKANAAVQLKAQELEQASQYKSDFLANMSHELRTPLNSSLILAKLLADNPAGNLTEEQVKYAQTIQSSGNDLLALINDILDLSKIEAGHMEVRAENLPIERLVKDLTRTFDPVAQQKGIEFKTEIDSKCPAAIETDRQRLEQIMKNLLSNAFKFTEKGKVTLRVAKNKAGDIAFSVTDTGIGISDEQQESVFDAFRQADGTISRKYGGTGLGLSICRELTRLLGGEIELESKAGKGSTFTVILPQEYDPSLVRPRTMTVAAPQPANTAKKADKETAPAPAKQPKMPKVAREKATVEDDREKLTANSRTILVVEDDRSFARILYDLVHELDFECLIAHTAEEALSVAKQYLPSAVVLDVGLPDHSGLFVLDRLKQNARTRHIPVHVVSASDYAQTALSLGAVGYMLKPVKREELQETLKKLETRMDHGLRRVLIVEDDPVQLDSVGKLLAGLNVETVGVGTAAECLNQLKESTFDCMILDLSLPDSSGYTLLETLSNEDAYSFPPVIVYTGRDLSADEEQRLRRYSKSIIIKGAKSPERLLDEVTLFLHQVVSELPPEQQKMLEKARNRDTVLEGRRILVVEDDVRNVYALTSIFEPLGAIVQIARNGREGLDMLEKSMTNSAKSVDLVLMDVMMPEMDGLTATREIRKRKEWKKLPIIMLTAKAMKDDQQRCLDAGANDYMAKPLDVEKLLSLVRVWMPR